MKSLTKSVFVILSLTILGVNSTGLLNSARTVSSGLVTGSHSLSDRAQASVSAAAASISGTVNAATSGIVESFKAAGAKATADIQNAAAREKTAVDVALAAIKNGLLQIEGCIEISVDAAASAKSLTSNIKNRLISTIEAGAELILNDVNVGIRDLNDILEKNKEKTINDAREGALVKRTTIQEALESVVLNTREEEATIEKNADYYVGIAVNDILNSRATLIGNNLNAARRISDVQSLPLGGLVPL